MAHVLITGVDGFTGRYLAPLLTDLGHEVHGLVQHAGRNDVPGVTRVHVADLGDLGSLCKVVDTVRPDRVVHLAGMTFVADDDAEAMYAVNLMGTRNLLMALTRAETVPAAILLASSANVYGNSTAGRLSESAAASPANDYAVSKLAMEHMARLFAKQLRIVICRPFNYTGVGQAPAFLLPKIVAHARRGQRQIELGNLDVARDFSDVRDVVRAYSLLLECEAAIGKTINICSGVAHTLTDVISIVESLSRIEFDVTVNERFVRDNEVKILLGDRTLLDSLVGPLAGNPLTETLRWMLQAP